MSARDEYLAGLHAGWCDERWGIVDPVPGYPDSDPYLAGVAHGRAAWRRERDAALIVEPDAPAATEDA